MNAVGLRLACAIFLIVAFSCSKSDPEPVFQNPCSSSADITDTSTPFAAVINDGDWTPDDGSFASFYDGMLSINAGDVLTQIGNKYVINIDIANPVEDYNNVSLGSGNTLMMSYLTDGSDLRGFVDCGIVKIESLDTINGFVSGYFHGTLTDRTSNVHIDISDGVFNLPLTSLFCEVPYDQEAVEVDLFNAWRLIGLFDSQGLLISPPPCHSSASIEFSVEDEDTDPVYGVLGFGIINRFSAGLELTEASTLSISNLVQSLAGGAIHEMDYEEQYFAVLTDSELQYEIDGNVLTLTNNAQGVELRFVLQE